MREDETKTWGDGGGGERTEVVGEGEGSWGISLRGLHIHVNVIRNTVQ